MSLLLMKIVDKTMKIRPKLYETGTSWKVFPCNKECLHCNSLNSGCLIQHFAPLILLHVNMCVLCACVILGHCLTFPAEGKRRVIIYALKTINFSAHGGRDGTSCLRQSYP